MMHLVTPELDKGPPVTYCKFSIRGDRFDRYWKEIEGQPIDEGAVREPPLPKGEKTPLFKLIRRHGLAREFPLIIATLKAFSEGRVRIEGGKVIDAQGKPVEGYNLTEEIERTVPNSAS